ncbi:MAG: hypothetical protein AB7N61_27870 [Acidimicrobiia bacterium]
MAEGDERLVHIHNFMGGMVVFERPLTPEEAFGLLQRWVDAQGCGWRAVEVEVNNAKVRSGVVAERVRESAEIWVLHAWVESNTAAFDLRNEVSRNGLAGLSARMDCHTVRDRSEPVEWFLAAVDGTPLRFAGQSYGQGNAVPHAQLFGYGDVDDVPLYGYVPGYPWLAVLGTELVKGLLCHRRIEDYPGLAPYALSQGAMVFRATEDPVTVTPELLSALRDFFSPMFPPPGQHSWLGALNPLAFTPEDLAVLQDRYVRHFAHLKQPPS